MKVFLAVFICKILCFIGKRVGKGSSLPGKVVLRFFPDVLGRLRLPSAIIAVTGSNGKTSTTELIVRALEAGGLSVGWNYEGSNQTEGVATLLLRIASFGGVVRRDAIVMECDERYAKKIFEKVRPSVLLVTNLCRDQLTRNGHPEFIEDCIRAAIGVLGDETQLVLNADDPYVAALAGGAPSVSVADSSLVEGAKVLWFGVAPFTPSVSVADSSLVEGAKSSGGAVGVYDDGAFCPVCKGRMSYDYRIAGHYGSYACGGCGLKRAEPEVEVFVQGDGGLCFGDGLQMSVRLPSVTSAYNFCAAVAVAKAVGIEVADSVGALDGYELTSGRVIRLALGAREGLLLLSKHENSFAYDRSLSWVVEQKKPCTVIVLVDAISRKYYTCETSWLWDIDFDLLADDYVKNVVLAGRYVNELGARFAFSTVDDSKIGYIEDLTDLRRYIEENTVGEIYAVTCFSDKAKLLGAMDNEQ